MTKPEAEALLEYLEERLIIVKERISTTRNNMCRYLCSTDPKDLITPANAYNGMTYTALLRWVQEEVALQQEIARLKNVLGR